MQALVSRILSSEMQRPSAVQVWQIPLAEVLPTRPAFPPRLLPLDPLQQRENLFRQLQRVGPRLFLDGQDDGRLAADAAAVARSG